MGFPAPLQLRWVMIKDREGREGRDKHSRRQPKEMNKDGDTSTEWNQGRSRSVGETLQSQTQNNEGGTPQVTACKELDLKNTRREDFYRSELGSCLQTRARIAVVCRLPTCLQISFTLVRDPGANLLMRCRCPSLPCSSFLASCL